MNKYPWWGELGEIDKAILNEHRRKTQLELRGTLARNKWIVFMRDKGSSFTEIANSLDLSCSRIRQIYEKTKRPK